MKRNLFRQIINEWRSNIWLTVEFAVVILAIWFILITMYLYSGGLFEPRGFNPDRVYSLSMRKVDDNSPRHNEGYTEEDMFYDFKQIVKRLRENPNVEAVAIHSSALPYNYNFHGAQISIAGMPDSIYYTGNMKTGSPDIVNVLEIKSLTGKTSDDLIAALKRGEILISNNPAFEGWGLDVKKIIGKKVYMGGDTTIAYKVGDVIQHLRRTDYEATSYYGTILLPIDEEKPVVGNVMIKVKPGREKAFLNDYENDAALHRQREVYLTDLQNLNEIRETLQMPIVTQFRLYVIIVVFLLATILLGLLGSFRFRIQQRISEIAIRKVFGATRGDIFRRILSEGFILLLVGVVISSGLIYPLADKIGDGDIKWYESLIFEAIAVALVAIDVVVSLWYPSYKAMKLEPAIAIKEE